MDLRAILALPDPDARLEAITADAYEIEEELAAFEQYLRELLQLPFEAIWRDPDEPEHAEQLQISGIDSVDERRGILLAVQRANGRRRRVLAEQLWASDASSVNARLLNDYRYWLFQGDSLDERLDGEE